MTKCQSVFLTSISMDFSTSLFLYLTMLQFASLKCNEIAAIFARDRNDCMRVLFAIIEGFFFWHLKGESAGNVRPSEIINEIWRWKKKMSFSLHLEDAKFDSFSLCFFAFSWNRYSFSNMMNYFVKFSNSRVSNNSHSILVEIIYICIYNKDSYFCNYVTFRLAGSIRNVKYWGEKIRSLVLFAWLWAFSYAFTLHPRNIVEYLFVFKLIFFQLEISQ